MKLLFMGDIVGEPGRKRIFANLSEIIKKEKIFFTIAQGENLAGGLGITPKTAQTLLEAGVDCITTGNHVWKHKEIYQYLNEETRLLRPANYPEDVPGRGSYVYEKQNTKIGVINLQGRAFMKPIDDPFRTGRQIAGAMQKETKNIFVDFHAEATSEKKALGFYLSELTTAFIGTHTHVATADEQIINNQTAYITDAGMVGSLDSVLGMEKDPIIRNFLLMIPQKFEPAKEAVLANCVIIDFNEKTGKANSIIRYNF